MTKYVHEITMVYSCRRKMSTMQPTKQVRVITIVYSRRNRQPSRAAIVGYIDKMKHGVQSIYWEIIVLTVLVDLPSKYELISSKPLILYIHLYVLYWCHLKDQLGIRLLIFDVRISYYLMYNFKYVETWVLDLHMASKWENMISGWLIRTLILHTAQ